MEDLRVLIVDDDVDMARLISFRLLRDAPHFSISIAGGGRECLEFLENNQVDCILSDYQMPEMDGMELLAAIRKQGNDIPFIFVTGQGNEQVARNAFKNGADDYYTKEVGFAHFARIINSVEQSIKKRIAERAKTDAETAMSASEARYHAFIANTSEAIWRVELDSPIPVTLPEDEQIDLVYRDAYVAECNEAAAHMFGYDSIEEFRGARMSDIMPRSDRNTETFKNFIRAGYRAARGEPNVVDRHGNKVYLRNSSLGMVENGFLVRVWGVSLDITRMKQAEELVAHSNKTLKDIFDNVNFGIMVIDCDHVIRMVNKAALEMMSYESETDIVNKMCEDLVCPTELNKCPIINLGMPINLSEGVILTRDGDRIPILKSVRAISLEGKEALLETFMEISNRVKKNI